MALDWRAFGERYIRDIVYAANDGLVTTFAVVAGVEGAGGRRRSAGSPARPRSRLDGS